MLCVGPTWLDEDDFEACPGGVPKEHQSLEITSSEVGRQAQGGHRGQGHWWSRAEPLVWRRGRRASSLPAAHGPGRQEAGPAALQPQRRTWPGLRLFGTL